MEQVLQLVEYSAAAVTAAVAVLLWVHSTFQSKKDAEREQQVLEQRFGAVKEDMSRAEQTFQKEIDTLKGDIQHVSIDVKSLRQEFRDDMSSLRSDLHAIKIDNVGIAKDMSYVRARLEPKA